MKLPNETIQQIIAVCIVFMPGITFEKREDGFNGLFCFATDVRSLTKQ